MANGGEWNAMAYVTLRVSSRVQLLFKGSLLAEKMLLCSNLALNQ